MEAKSDLKPEQFLDNSPSNNNRHRIRDLKLIRQIIGAASDPEQRELLENMVLVRGFDNRCGVLGVVLLTSKSLLPDNRILRVLQQSFNSLCLQRVLCEPESLSVSGHILRVVPLVLGKLAICRSEKLLPYVYSS